LRHNENFAREIYISNFPENTLVIIGENIHFKEKWIFQHYEIK